ncbi:MAG: 3-phosphoshikimate 1-carboxyvinyltransferase [Tannerellaceae bacterium]|nr:3-phosphoshikimate 1-carboxyvinyltransferase [Tannerellaceae bacterium]
MIYHITKPQASVRASIQLPASKSISNRVLILNALSYSHYEINNLSESDDTYVMTQALTSNGNYFDIGAAGTSMRFLTAYLSKVIGEWTITGTERMKKRPIRLLVDALNSVGARIEYLEKEGFPPLRIWGSALQGGEISLSGGVSSQYISALLMIAPYMEKGLHIHLEGTVISRPYIRLTLALMKQFGVSAEWKGQTIRIPPQEYQPVPFTVESDWSAASYWYAITAFSPGAVVELPHLFRNSLQGDSAGADLFSRLGVITEFGETGVTLTHTGEIVERLEYDFVNEPDLAQTCVVACTLMNIPFRFTGLQTLKIKETDRLEALKTELKKLGYLVTDRENCILEWNGERCEPEQDPVIQTYEDHRMAMAFAPAALLLPQGIRIEDPEVVSKSYPRYWEDLQTAGFLINAQLTIDN